MQRIVSDTIKLKPTSDADRAFESSSRLFPAISGPEQRGGWSARKYSPCRIFSRRNPISAKIRQTVFMAVPAVRFFRLSRNVLLSALPACVTGREIRLISMGEAGSVMFTG